MNETKLTDIVGDARGKTEKFRQVVEFRTSRIDDLNAYFDAWITRTQGQRIPHEAVVCKDRDADNVYLLMVEFASRAVAMENSGQPEVGEFGAFLTSICEAPLTFRNLDVLRSESL